MDTNQLTKQSDFSWKIEAHGKMRVPAVIYADHELIHAMDNKVREQITNVACLPGIVTAAYALPDAHWGYGFPIGGVAAFDPDAGGVISAGGVGFDISCGVRNLHTNLSAEQIEAVKEPLADRLFATIPAGVGSTGKVRLDAAEMDQMLRGGAAWAVRQGFGRASDLERIEEGGCMAGALPEYVSAKAKQRQTDEMGTLGSGNHYLEVQRVREIFDEALASAFGLRLDDAIVSIHCGSRGLGHQIGTEFLHDMAVFAKKHDLYLPDRELACASVHSELGVAYLGAMRAGINCALANRQILTHLSREVFAELLPDSDLRLLYDVSHNTCKLEEHVVEGKRKALFVHRKGATRSFGPGHPALPEDLRSTGQPVFIGGTMGTESYVLCGTEQSAERAFGSSCHGAGRAMSRHEARKSWRGRALVQELAESGILIRSPSYRGVAEEAPPAYKDVNAVVGVAESAGLARRVARLEPLICIKG